jgi:RNA polymerase sigma factor (sigma-70 family)
MAAPRAANHVATAMEPPELIELIRRHAGLIHRIAGGYCRDAADRDDVVQEVALQLWRSRGRYDPRFRETTWVYRVAINVAISFLRRERRHRARREPLEEHGIKLAIPAGAAAAAAERGEELERLRGCIDGLGALDRALVLLWLDGNDHAVIGDVLGLSVSNVGTKLFRIKERLRAALGEKR